MIDTKKLHEMVLEMQLMTLNRIRHLSDLAGIFDGLEYTIAMERGDEYLMAYIKAQHQYAQVLTEYEQSIGQNQEALWERLMSIDN